MRSFLRSSSVFVVLSLLAFACEPKDDDNVADEFQKALPAEESVKIDVPNNEGSGALTLGEMAPFYQMTRGVSVAVNSRVVGLIAWIRLITLFPATEKGDDYRVWGPTEPKGLEVASWQLRVVKVAENRFSFDLEARAKGADGDFLPIISGEVTPGEIAGKGTGSMTLFFDNAKTLHIDECGKGQVAVDWNASQPTRTVDVQWIGFENTCDNTQLADATYHYTQDADYAGTFEFVTVGNIHAAAEAKPLLETVTMRSRWEGNGHGRSDVYIEGEEVTADLVAAGLSTPNVQATQCWDELFLLTYMDVAPDELEPFIYAEDGDPATCAPFVDAEFPSL